MRISHKKKFIFLSKPKCASVSVRAMLEPYSDIFSGEEYPFHHHVKAFELFEHFKEMDWNWDDYYKFITIRNPWEMIVSYYNFFKPDINGTYFFMGKAGNYNPKKLIKFNDWVKSPRTWHYMKYENGEFKRDVWTRDFSSLTANDYILGVNGEVLVDYIVRVENIEEDLAPVFDKLGIPFYTPPVHNVYEHKPYQQYYNKESKKIIEEQFYLDIEIGNYKF